MSLSNSQTSMLPTLKVLDSQLDLHVKQIRSLVATQLELSGIPKTRELARN